MKSIVSIAFLSFASLLVAGNSAQASEPPPENAPANTPANTNVGQLDADDESALDDSMDVEEVEAADDDVEDALAAVVDADDMPDVADLDSLDALVKENRGKYLTPAGCIESTRLGKGEWSHVLSDCEGPRGRFTVSGTVHAKWSLEDGVLSVERDYSDVVLKGKRVTVTGSGEKQVSFSREGSIITRHRVGDFEGTIQRNKGAGKALPFKHQGDFTTTWDRKGKEYTRDGGAQSTIGQRELTRTVSGYKAKGSRKACPEAGQVVIERKQGDKQLTIDFLGGQDVQITTARGRQISKQMKCGDNQD